IFGHDFVHSTVLKGTQLSKRRESRAFHPVLLFLNHQKQSKSETVLFPGPKQLLRAGSHNAHKGEKVSGVSILGFFTEGQESDPRVLKAQLTLAATTARNTRITSPVWAVACAVLTSTGVFGHVSFASTLFLPLAVTAAMGAGALMATAYQHYNDSEGDVDS